MERHPVFCACDARRHRRLRVTVSALAGAVSAQGAKFDSPVVSAQWLADTSERSVTSSCCISPAIARDYTTGHIPGARFLWFNDVAPSNPDLNTELPSVAKLDSLFESLGVSDNSRVVVYGQTISPLVARVFMTLDYLGAGGSRRGARRRVHRLEGRGSSGEHRDADGEAWQVHAGRALRCGGERATS